MQTIVYIDGFNLYYHRALETIPNLKIYRGRYLPKQVGGLLIDPVPGERTKRTVTTYEEKGTDVNIASLLLVDGYERRYESAVVMSNDGDLKMPIELVRTRLDMPVTVVNPVLKRRGRRRSAALSPDPLPGNAAFIQLKAKDVFESQFPDEVQSPKGATLGKPPGW